MELASDHKDFATALARTRLAEMTKHKVVPIPQPKLQFPPSPRKSRSRSRSRSAERGSGTLLCITYEYISSDPSGRIAPKFTLAQMKISLPSLHLQAMPHSGKISKPMTILGILF